MIISIMSINLIIKENLLIIYLLMILDNLKLILMELLLESLLIDV
jgi:hypothetical protein